MALFRPLLTALALLALAYIGVCAWMYATQRDAMYFPQFTQVDADQTDFQLRRDGVTLRGWRVNPGRPAAVVYFGGNAERIEFARDEFATWFPDHTVYLVAYRGYGASDGTPREADLYADAVALFDHVSARHSGPVGVVGRSLGSGVAGYLASQRPVARLVLITPFDSLAHVGQLHYPWLPVRRLLQDRYESARHLARYRGPVLVVRAGNDQVIPAASTDRLIASLQPPPQVVELPGADHNTIGGDPGFGEALRGFVNR